MQTGIWEFLLDPSPTDLGERSMIALGAAIVIGDAELATAVARTMPGYGHTADLLGHPRGPCCSPFER